VALRILIAVLAPALASAQLASNLVLQISTETAPPGGSVQLKLSLTAPALVGTGRIVLDLDPTVFGNIGTVSVFSAAGDVYGIATVQGQHLDASFTSPSGGIGQLRNLPVLVATVPILQSANPGTVATVTADASQSAWQDAWGNAISVAVAAGFVTVGGTLSIQNVTSTGAKLRWRLYTPNHRNHRWGCHRFHRICQPSGNRRHPCRPYRDYGQESHLARSQRW